MDDAKSHLKGDNAIATNGNLREQLETLHEMLGLEVTEVAANALQFGSRFSAGADKVLTCLGNISSDLTIALMEARKSKKNLSDDEQKDYDEVRSLNIVIGNLQGRLNRIVRAARQVNELNLQMKQDGIGLDEEIMASQQKLREVRSGLNAIGFLSANPNLARLIDAKNHPTHWDGL